MNIEEIKEYKKQFTEEQLDEMAKLYDEGEKTKNIIQKYNLKISTNQISLFLPKIETDKICPYCNIPMKRRRKRDPYYADEQCEKCGHFYEKWHKKCECVNCKEKEIQLIKCKKEKIRSYYSKCIPTEKIEYSELKFRERCLLYFLYYIIDKKVNFEYLSHKVIRNSTVVNLIKKLKQEGIIYVSPDSEIDAFLDDDDFPSKYYVSEVDYVVNVIFSESDKVALTKKKFTLEGVSEDEIKQLMYELIYEDLLIEFETLLKERNIEFEPSAKQEKDFRKLLTEGSYTQIKYICYKVAVFYSDGITTGRLYRRKVPQQVLASVVTFYYNNLNKYGEVYRSDPEYAGTVLRIFIEDILGKDVSILNEVI